MQEHNKLDHFLIFFLSGILTGMGVCALILGIKIQSMQEEAIEKNVGGYNVKTGRFEFKCQH